MKQIQIVAEIGINYAFGEDINKFLDNAKKLIDICNVAKINYVKLQKRNPDKCVPEHQKYKEKIVPWRDKPTTYLQYKKDIEFGYDEYQELFKYCETKDIQLFASVWDTDSAEFMREFTDIVKIPSAKITDYNLLDRCRNFETKLMSTGMSTEKEIEAAIKILDPDVIFHTNSVYPAPVEDLNLGYIEWLENKYPDKEIGLSSHYYGLIPAIAVVLLKAKWVEFHITLDHSNFGSDQLSSVEPSGIFKLVKGIRDLEKAYRGEKPRKLYPGEEKKLKSLRG